MSMNENEVMTSVVVLIILCGRTWGIFDGYPLFPELTLRQLLDGLFLTLEEFMASFSLFYGTFVQL